VAVSSLCAHAQMTSTALSPRAPPSAESEGRSRARFGALANGCLMGAVGRVGPAGVTLQFAIARRARGSCATVRELNHALRRGRAPRLLGTISEVTADTASSRHREKRSAIKRAGAGVGARPTPISPDVGANGHSGLNERAPHR